jgi:hypothetical protein
MVKEGHKITRAIQSSNKENDRSLNMSNEEIAAKFLEHGWVKEARLYNDPRNLGIKRIRPENFPEEVREVVKLFLLAVNAPIFLDDLNNVVKKEDTQNVDHYTRKPIKDTIFKTLGEKARTFYDSNKLKTSNILGVLKYVDTFPEFLSEKNIKEMEELKEMVSDSSVKGLNSIKYQNEPDIRKRLVIVEKYQHFLEDALIDLAVKYNIRIGA